MKKLILLLLLCFQFLGLVAQDILWTKGVLTMTASAPLDTVVATTEKIECKINKKTKTIFFKTNIHSLQFEHPIILENMAKGMFEIEKYPDIVFEGSTEDWKNKSSVIVKGKLTMNGVQKYIEAKLIYVEMEKAFKVTVDCEINISDFKVNIPTLLKDALSERVLIHIEGEMKEVKLSKK